MYQAFLAGRFLLGVLAGGEPFVGVFFQVLACRTKLMIFLFAFVVESYHQRYSLFLSFYSGLHSNSFVNYFANLRIPTLVSEHQCNLSIYGSTSAKLYMILNAKICLIL